MAPEKIDTVSLTTLLLHESPKLPARKALVLMDLQRNAFLPESQMPVAETSFFDRIRKLTIGFRPSGDLVWVHTGFEDSKQSGYHGECGCSVVNNLASCSLPNAEESAEEDDTLGLAWSQSPLNEHTAGGTGSSCARATSPLKQKWPHPTRQLVPSLFVKAEDRPFLTPDAPYESRDIQSTSNPDQAGEMAALVQQHDLQIVKTYHSAFKSTSLLLTLRSKFIDELYICGCMTDVSLHETVVDASRCGIKVVLVQDCLGYRKGVGHDFSFQGLIDLVGADVVTSDDITAALSKAHGS